jgi:hypothetical protein
MDETQVPDLGKLARQAYAFIQTEYGETLIQRMVALHGSLTEQAENAETVERTALLSKQASGVKQCIDLILKEAQLVSSGQLEAMETLEKQQEEAAVQQ